MQFKKIEHHNVIITKVLELSEEEITDAGVTVEDIQNFLADEDIDDDIYDIIHELVTESEVIDHDENWISDNKGYTEITYELIENE